MVVFGWIAVIANVVMLSLPAVFVVFFLINSPTYMDPMIRDPLGVALLVLGVVVVAAGYAATYLAVRLLRARRPGWVFLLVVATTFICSFPALWLVLLGPAVVILMHRPSA